LILKRIYCALIAATTISAAVAITADIDGIFKPLIGSHDPGAAVMLRRDGHSVFLNGYGVADLNTFGKIEPETNFRLASVTKQFTAMAIMLLVHDGKLRYEETLRELFPDFPAYGRDIPVRQLLTHTSGLPDYEDLMGPQWSAEHQITDSEVLALLKQQSKGKFAPGRSWAYSNSAYVVLGLIVAKVSGEPFADFLKTRIFDKLQMTSTVMYVKGKNVVPNRAYGYNRNERGEFVPSDQSATSATLGDGGVYSNLLDLAKWDDALRNGSLLPAPEMSVGMTPIRLTDGSSPSWPVEPGENNLAPGKPVAYGFGWFLDPYKGRPREWHFGGTSGFRTAIERFTRDNVTVVILANRTDLDPGSLALRVADLALSTR
jgi:CubicO group peptidase (beta-lactamase class C family)